MCVPLILYLYLYAFSIYISLSISVSLSPPPGRGCLPPQVHWIFLNPGGPFSFPFPHFSV
jgi:hypothetical protein